MAETTCPECGTTGEGRFCAQCGTPLAAVECPSCGTTLPAGSRFCSRCGSPVGGGASASAEGSVAVPPPEGGGGGGDGYGTRLGWIVAGVALVALIVVVALPVLQRDEPPPAGGGAPAAGPPDLSSMSPRQAADRLFNRVMQANAAGDTAQVDQFMPMAIQAYERIGELDADGRYHLAVLQNTAGSHEAALATAESVLEEDPGHLLALAAAAHAAEALGREEEARAHYRRLADSFEDERERGLPEYEAHSALLPDLRAEAEAYVEGGGG